jgi:hypothetical protein
MKVDSPRRILAGAVIALSLQGFAVAQKNVEPTTSARGAFPRTPEGRPDFSGYYDIPYVPNMAFGKEEAVPYTAEGRKAFKNRDLKDDPTANCWLPGVPRIMQSPYPVQFVQNRDFLIILFEYMHTFRAIPLNGRPHPANMEPAFMGDSTGHWEGATLVVDTTGLKGAPWTWLDTAGHQHSDQLHVIEKFTRTPDSISYEYTVDDPKMYAGPWTHHRELKPLKLAPGIPEIIEYNCSENNRDIPHLMSTKPSADPKP